MRSRDQRPSRPDSPAATIWRPSIATHLREQGARAADTPTLRGGGRGTELSGAGMRPGRQQPALKQHLCKLLVCVCCARGIAPPACLCVSRSHNRTLPSSSQLATRAPSKCMLQIGPSWPGMCSRQSPLPASQSLQGMGVDVGGDKVGRERSVACRASGKLPCSHQAA